MTTKKETASMAMRFLNLSLCVAAFIWLFSISTLRFEWDDLFAFGFFASPFILSTFLAAFIRQSRRAIAVALVSTFGLITLLVVIYLNADDPLWVLSIPFVGIPVAAPFWIAAVVLEVKQLAR